MAKKSKNVKVKAGEKTSVRRKGKKVHITLGKKAVIALLVLVLIAAIALTAFYFIAPASFRNLFGIRNKGGNLPPTDLKGQILEVHYLDVGQGDSIILKFPDGKNMIIDAGGSTNKSGIKPKDKILGVKDELGINVFDYALVTHTDSDHSGYMDDVIENFDVKNIFLPDFDGATDGSEKATAGKIPTQTFGDVVEAATSETYFENGATKNATVHKNVGTLVIEENDLYKITAYCRSADYYDTVKAGNAHLLNSVSPMLVIDYAERTLLFTGDAEGAGQNDTEHWFIEKGMEIDCDVLKVGHHGSEASNSSDFLEYVDPEYAVISCGVGNSYDHPRPENLDRLEKYVDLKDDGDYRGIARVFRTDQDGDVLLRIGSDGSGMQLDTQTEQESSSASAWLPITCREYPLPRRAA